MTPVDLSKMSAAELMELQQQIAKEAVERQKAEAQAAVKAIEKKIASERAKFEKTIAPLRDKIAESEAAFKQTVKDHEAELRKALKTSGAKPRARTTATRAGGRTNAPRGQNQRVLLTAIKATPGATAAQLANKTGLSTAITHATLQAAAKNGLVTKDKTADGVGHKITQAGTQKLVTL